MVLIPIREFRQLNGITQVKSEISLTFSEAKSISSSPYAILTLQSDEFSTTIAQKYFNRCHRQKAHRGKLVTSVELVWEIALRFRPHKLSYVQNIHSFTLECLQKQMNVHISCKIYTRIEGS